MRGILDVILTVSKQERERNEEVMCDALTWNALNCA
jgi:hypothetical protein